MTRVEKRRKPVCIRRAIFFKDFDATPHSTIQCPKRDASNGVFRIAFEVSPALVIWVGMNALV